MVTAMVDEENFGILDQVKWSNLAFSQYISQNLNKAVYFKAYFSFK